MKSLGAVLREAREKKGVTLSDAASATRIKFQILEDLENNRFQRTHAPIYARGFLKIYGEYLELDIAELLAAYTVLPHSSTPLDLTPLPRNEPVPEGGVPGPARANARVALATSVQTLRGAVRRAAASAAALAARLTASRTVPAPERPQSGRARSATAIRARLLRVRRSPRGNRRIRAATLTAVAGALLIAAIAILAARRRDPARIPPGGEPADFMEFTHAPPEPYY